jgi:hypothetical protein
MGSREAVQRSVFETEVLTEARVVPGFCRNLVEKCAGASQVGMRTTEKVLYVFGIGPAWSG